MPQSRDRVGFIRRAGVGMYIYLYKDSSRKRKAKLYKDACISTVGGCQRGEKKKPISSSTTLFFQSFTLLLAPLCSTTVSFFLCLVQNH